MLQSVTYNQIHISPENKKVEEVLLFSYKNKMQKQVDKYFKNIQQNCEAEQKTDSS